MKTSRDEDDENKDNDDNNDPLFSSSSECSFLRLVPPLFNIKILSPSAKITSGFKLLTVVIITVESVVSVLILYIMIDTYLIHMSYTSVITNTELIIYLFFLTTSGDHFRHNSLITSSVV